MNNKGIYHVENSSQDSEPWHEPEKSPHIDDSAAYHFSGNNEERLPAGDNVAIEDHTGEAANVPPVHPFCQQPSPV